MLVDDTLVLLRDATDLTELVGVIEKFHAAHQQPQDELFEVSAYPAIGKYGKMDVANSDAPEAGQL